MSGCRADIQPDIRYPVFKVAGYHIHPTVAMLPDSLDPELTLYSICFLMLFGVVVYYFACVIVSVVLVRLYKENTC